MNTVIGKKIAMTQIFKDDGALVPVTVIKCEGTTVVGIVAKEKRGYNAIVMGYGKANNPTLPYRGLFRGVGGKVPEVVMETRTEKIDGINIGALIPLSIFEVGDKVSVTGISKGKGFQGPIKKWNFSRGPMSHGSHSHRVQGSIGSSADPSRVWKGKKMAGRMGGVRVTTRNLLIVKMDEKENLIYIRGAVPGVRKGVVLIRKSRA